MSGLSSHVLDTALGTPARGLALRLDIEVEVEAARAGSAGTAEPSPSWQLVTTTATDGDGRARDLLGGASLQAGTYRLTFETGPYFHATGRPVFYPRVEVIFTIAAPGEHHHIPLLLAPFGYSTYRGS